MKVLQLCGKDFFGAGRAAYRLHKGLLQCGIESKMWVGAKRTLDETVTDIHREKWKKKLTKVYVNLEKIAIKSSAGGYKEMFSLGHPAHSIRRRIKKEKPDIIHLHWINRGYMDLLHLKNIKIPIVISLHDMWWFTGGCHYDVMCGRYTVGCGNCPLLNNDGEFGLSFRHLCQKQEVLYSIPNVTLVGLSGWMRDCAAQSLIGRKAQTVQLPNGIDVDHFTPLDKQLCREKLNLPLDKKLILFAAVDVLSESRKGYAYISEALALLNADEYELVVIGEKCSYDRIGGLKARFLGEINDDQCMIEYMSAVDVTVVPSLQENLSNLIMESMACATPVVAFQVGGNSDMIQHRTNGYLAAYRDVVDLSEGIKYCAETTTNSHLSSNARKYIMDHFSIHDIAKKYAQLYESILNR
ncbi:glycosyltransferase [Saccharicrinis fermentans]|uniref:Lipopolysaccharide 1,2-N-acetylglucosaminetransferase n=1 Tax=Saccharicrinis fermentans DSM 9555 = JCM 21142 TaxID=869213 RepID=W7Y673_9BACT|nr:glycosyltransferase [Saccharicrinis fermentans]GAF03662.1 lipopolysaccharide 1,2-N-acetylglucosaminetransferase [Saccharicrinis fermentans DSM 9555 = JCM 21142]